MAPHILKKFLLFLALAAIPVFAVIFWRALSTEPTLPSFTEGAGKAGEAMLADLRSLPPREIKEDKENFIVEEDGKDGIEISYAGQGSGNREQGIEENQPKTKLSLPKDYGKPIEVKLDDQRTVLITDLNGSEDYEAGILADQPTSNDQQSTGNRRQSVILNKVKDLVGLDSSSSTQNDTDSLGGSTSKYLAYTSPDERKTLLYAYQKDQATGEKKLKNWTLYNYGLGKETESYRIENAKVKIDDDGNADVFFFSQSDIQSEQAKADVDPNLMDRAQRFLQQETGNDIMNDENRTPDFTIPKPTYFTKDGVEHEAEWNVILSESEGSRDSSASLGMTSSSVVLTVSLTENPDLYPIALDPTLAFTVPGSTTSGGVISGESSSYFGWSLTSGDFNADGKIDLAVGSPEPGYGSTHGKVYVFYNDVRMAPDAKSADVLITGVLGTKFGYTLAAGDLNNDGKTDLIVGDTDRGSTPNGRVYIFYNDGSYPALASGADVAISGEASSVFGCSLTTGDFNADGKTDLAAGSYAYSSYAGRAYIFYNDGSIPTTAVTADVIINAQTSGDTFGVSMTSGDFNADGKTDLAVGAYGYSSSTGRAYIFYADGTNNFGTASCTGSAPTLCLSADADIIISGSASSYFGVSMVSGDFNADGKTDLAIGASNYSVIAGAVYLFYNDGSIPTTAATADVTLSGSGNFGTSLISGDFNQDGRTDLAVSAYIHQFTGTSGPGWTYIFYNDGSIPTTAATADVAISGETAGNSFGYGMASGDLNADGKTDLAVGAYGYASNTGRAYIFYSQNGQVNTNKSIAGESTNQDFGRSFAAGDFNADGKTDLAVGAENYDTGSSNVGRVYIFYNDGSYPTGSATADAIITGEAASDYFSFALTSGDFNQDGKMDLVVGAYGYSGSTGRVYIFYNGNITNENASGADYIISGTPNYFGFSFATGDFNIDGKTDLLVGTYYYSGIGRAYLFYNDGSIPTVATSADVIFVGATSSDQFGTALVSGDFNADGKTDFIIGANSYSSETGRIHLFYADGTNNYGTQTCAGTPSVCYAADADFNITDDGASRQFGEALTSGDFNTDGRMDFAVGARKYNSSDGRAYVFYNDGTYPSSAGSADVVINPEPYTVFGESMVSGDFNADGRTDLVVGSGGYNGKAYIFYNDDSYPTSAANADVGISGEASTNYFSVGLAAGDFNADGRTDLVVGAYGNTTNTGKVYFYETRENFAWNLQPVSGLRTSPNFSGQEMKITGESGTTGRFSASFASGDFNADGKTDLAVGASGYSTNTGRTYIFYDDGSFSPGASSADVIITGETTSDVFGSFLSSGDFNADGKTDLAVAASGYSTNTGRAYIFYQDGSYPTAAAFADVIITGEASSDYFGISLVSGDFNADGKTDFVVGAMGYSSTAGRVYLFYQDGNYPSGASAGDMIVTGEASSGFGFSLFGGDYNADGKTDLAVGGFFYSVLTGRVYLLYNDGSYPTAAASADVIIQGEASSSFGISLASGDFNADGKTDLAVGAVNYSFNTGRIYIFHNDGSIPTTAATADVIITGEASSYFGASLASGDFSADGKTDLAVGADSYSSNTGRAYIFYQDGSYPTAAASADIIITGDTINNYYGDSLVSGDFNADGKADLVVGAYGYSSSRGRTYLYTFNDGVITGETTSNSFGVSLTSGDFNADGRTDLAVGGSAYDTGSSDVGRVYIFYNDGLNYPTGAASADVIITGETTSNSFGRSLVAGDFNADGKTDLAVGAYGYSSGTGRAYLFYNDGSYPTTAATADVTITGEATINYFSYSLAAGDFNADGKTDLAVGADSYSSNTGRAYIFYNDGSYPTTAATADVTITGEANSYFGYPLAAGDFNADGKTDLAVGAGGYSTNTGRAYIFYNDGSIPTTAATADVIITGEASSYFGISLTSGDFNADGKTDLAVGAWRYSTDTGRAYIFYNDGSIPTTAATADVIITGVGVESFGDPLSAGDMNDDGRIDLVVGAFDTASNPDRVYIFYNDGAYPSTSSSADIVLSGENNTSDFSSALSISDFNQNGKTDLAVSASSYSTDTGRVYIFITEAKAESVDQALLIKGNFKTSGSFQLK